jgi:hypothetical protein
MTSSVYEFEYTAAKVFITPTENALNYSTKSLNGNFTYALPENLPSGGGARNVVSEPAENLMHTVEDFASLISTSGGGPIYDTTIHPYPSILKLTMTLRPCF